MRSCRRRGSTSSARRNSEAGRRPAGSPIAAPRPGFRQSGFRHRVFGNQRMTSTDVSQLVATGPLLVAAGIEKAFGRTRALAGAGIDIRRGEIHALLGANGAGKSTLARVISGHIRRDAGEILFKEKRFLAQGVRDALDAGIALVTQETSLAPDLSVLENIFLPPFGRPGLPRFGAMRRKAEAVLARLGHQARLPLDREVRGLSAAERQLIEIAKALALDVELII